MNRILKKILALGLSVLMAFSVLAACDGTAQTDPTTDPTAEPQVTQDPEEAKTLKILTIGHSLAVDSGHMLALIADKEGYEDMKVATLYYAGCSLAQHVNFMTNDSPEYNLYISSTETADKIPAITENVTMRKAIESDYWDIIVMQDAPFYLAQDGKYKDGNLTRLLKFVNEHKKNPDAVFAWHMFWGAPLDETLRVQYPGTDNFYNKNYIAFGNDRTTLFESTAKCAQDNILTNDAFKYVIPTATGIENALSSYLEETDLHRDYVHASDLGRVIASYIWFCTLTGVDHLDEIKLDTIPKAFFKSTVADTDRVLTESEKNIILESVNNALAKPFEITQSQYTEAPVQ